LAYLSLIPFALAQIKGNAVIEWTEKRNVYGDFKLSLISENSFYYDADQKALFYT
jgi:hypothetical protein